MLIPILLAVLAGLLQALLLWTIRTVWPTRDPVLDARREADLRRRFGATSDKVSDLVTLAAMAGALAGPFLGYQLARALALARSPERDDIVLFFGFAPMAVPLILAGYLAVVALGPAFIRWRYRGERRLALLWLYSRGEREEGAAGRWAIRNAGQLAVAASLIPLLLWGNRYTLVGARRIEVPSSSQPWSRLAIATDDVTHLAIRGQPRRVRSARQRHVAGHHERRRTSRRVRSRPRGRHPAPEPVHRRSRGRSGPAGRRIALCSRGLEPGASPG